MIVWLAIRVSQGHLRFFLGCWNVREPYLRFPMCAVFGLGEMPKVAISKLTANDVLFYPAPCRDYRFWFHYYLALQHVDLI